MGKKPKREELDEAELDRVKGGVTIDAGAVLKLQDVNIDAGSGSTSPRSVPTKVTAQGWDYQSKEPTDD